MLRPVDEGLQELMYLRDVVIPWMRANPRRVDFSHWVIHRDTYFNDDTCTRCFGGWYMFKRFGKTGTTECVAKALGIGIGEASYLCSGSRDGTLDDRARYVDRLIRVKAEQLARTQRATPVEQQEQRLVPEPAL